MSHLIFSFFVNLIALGAAVYLIEGFEIAAAPASFLKVTAIFTAINIFIKPVLKVIFSPIIVITLGVGIILINMLALYSLDFFLADISIRGLTALFYATLVVSLINIVINVSAKRLYKD
ncbi:phage holin family protein [Candidatus Wolfebacteria bacterium]|nr:phage holin family protein [Candidatus Wolfebacteria bacterium]